MSMAAMMLTWWLAGGGAIVLVIAGTMQEPARADHTRAVYRVSEHRARVALDRLERAEAAWREVATLPATTTQIRYVPDIWAGIPGESPMIMTGR